MTTTKTIQRYLMSKDDPSNCKRTCGIGIYHVIINLFGNKECVDAMHCNYMCTHIVLLCSSGCDIKMLFQKTYFNTLFLHVGISRISTGPTTICGRYQNRTCVTVCEKSHHFFISHFLL